MSTLKWIFIGLLCGIFPAMIPFAILLLIADFLGGIAKCLDSFAKSLK